MYRLALATLLALAVMDIATACPPAQSRVTVVEGKQVREWFCPPGRVLYMHEGVYRCFERCAFCPNGFCHENKCHCFPGTHPEGPGVCGKICGNCENGWCSSASKCECNDGFTMIDGRCSYPSQQAPTYNIPPGYPYWPPPWDPRFPPQGYPQPNPGYPPPNTGYQPPNSGYPPQKQGYPPGYPSYGPYGRIPNDGSGILPGSAEDFNQLEPKMDNSLKPDPLSPTFLSSFHPPRPRTPSCAPGHVWNPKPGTCFLNTPTNPPVELTTDNLGPYFPD